MPNKDEKVKSRKIIYLRNDPRFIARMRMRFIDSMRYPVDYLAPVIDLQDFFLDMQRKRINTKKED